MKIPFLNRNQNEALLFDALQKLQCIRQQSEILAICAKPTGYSWLGVNVATKSLFPKFTFEIPQYYSNSVFNEKELAVLSSSINELKYNQVIYSGFAPFYQQICLQLNSSIKQKVIYHGFLAELSENAIQHKVFKIILDLAESKNISAIGFVKKGLALSIEKYFNIPTFEIILPNKIVKETAIYTQDKIKIGCLVNTTFRKNIHNQVVAASMIKGAEVHVFRTNELKYIDHGQLVYHDLMDHDTFLKLLGSMTVNLHTTLSESWGQVLSESISLGVPCLSGYTSAFFDYDEELKQKLIVPGFDDSWHIYSKIEEVLKEREYLSNRCIDYAGSLNMLVKERMVNFLTV